MLNRKLKNDITGYLFILPNIIGILAFILFPVVFSFIVSFTNWDYTQGLATMKFIGIKNYIDIWKDTWFTQSLFNTFIFAVTVTPITVMLSITIAVMFDHFVYSSFKKPLQLMMLMPYITNIVAVSIVWVMMYAPFGPFTQLVKAFGIQEPPRWLASYFWALPAVIVMTIWIGLGYAVLIYTAAIHGLPIELYEAAEIDGAGEIRKFFSITIPLLNPTTFFIVITNFIGAFQIFGQIQVMTRGGPGSSTSTLGYYIYTTAFSFYKMGYAASIAWILFIILLIITLIQWFVIKEKDA